MENTLANYNQLRDGKNKSIWQSIAQKITPNLGKADDTSIYDVLIVGGGITGVTTALQLQKAGKKCIIAEASNLGFGTTGGTTAHLNTFFDTPYPQMESDFGQDGAKLVAEAGQTAIDAIKDFIKAYQIDCDFEQKDGYLFSQNEKETKELTEIFESCQKLGVAVKRVHENGAPIAFEQALCFPNQAQFHPLKYILALAEEFKSLGGVIAENTFIAETSFKDETYIATAQNLTIKAKNLVYATHMAPGINLLTFRCAPYRSYVLGVKLSDNDYPNSLIYDMKEPYHYLRTHVIDGQKYLIVGGEDHKTGHDDPTAAFSTLKDFATTYHACEEITFQWSAQYYEPADGLPYIGELPGGDDRTYIATGYSGNGMIYGTLSGLIIADLILGRANKFADLFKPSRIKPIAGFTEFVKENADVAYHFVADRIATADLESLTDLQRGEGKVVDFEGKKVALYKDEQGIITALNPVCTHAKCIVSFNSEEKSWDCPCHGGRFDLEGKVITGPPRADLSPIDISK